MASFNRVVLMGNLTRDVELKYLQSGTAVADVGLAVNDRRKSGDEWIEEVTFVDVTLFARSAEIAAEYLGKGSQVLIEGRLKLDQWQSPDGENRSKLKVVCDQLKMVGAKKEGSGSSDAPKAKDDKPASKKAGRPAKATTQAPPADDEIPF